MKKIVLFILGIFFLGIGYGQTTYYWRTEATSGNWNNSSHWWNGTAPTLPTGAEILRFDNNNQVSMTNDLSATNRYQIYFDAGASTARNISGSSTNTFYDYSGNNPKIENQSTATHVVGFPISLGYNPMEINPVNGGLTFNGTINLNDKYLDIWGNNGNTLTFNGIISGTGGITLKQNSTLLLTATNTYSGPTTVEAGNLTLEGSIAFSNVTIKSGATLTINGTSTAVNNLTIESGGVVTVNPGKSLTINGTFTNSNGNSGLVIKSDATGNGSVIYSGSGQSATVERYIAGYSGSTDGWHFLSSPVNSFTITGSDFEPEANDDFYAFDEGTNTWLNQKIGGNNITTFTNGEAYLVAYQTTATKSFTGTLNNSDITFTNLSVGTGSGWHLLGNPYPSALIWNETAGDWALSNIGGVAKIWNDASDNYTDIAADGIIPVSNGFFVQASSSTNSITIPTTSQTHSTTNNYKQGENNSLKIKVTNSANPYWDENTVGFRSHASVEYDLAIDSRKLFGGTEAPQIWTTAAGEDFSINYLPQFSSETAVPLNFMAGVDADYTLTFSGHDNFTQATQVILEDLQTGQMIDLNQSPEYTFNASTSDDQDRFVLHFYHLAGIETNTPESPIQVYSSDHTISVLNPESLALQIRIYDLSGRLILTTPKLNNSLIKRDLNLPAGIYAIEVLTSENSIQKKLFID